MTGPDPRPEPRDARGAVLHAATRLFAERGFDGTTIQAIADALGVTKTAVLHHYPSKEELRAAVLASVLEHWQRLLPGLLVKATASEDRFDAVFDVLQRFFAADPHLARLVTRWALDHPDEASGLLRSTVRPWLEAVGVYVEQGRAAGLVHADVDPTVYAGLIMLLVIAASSMSHLVPAVVDGDGQARAAAELKRIARAALFPGSPRP
jgi:TetR/AcrR family transcriptional regulator